MPRTRPTPRLGSALALGLMLALAPVTAGAEGAQPPMNAGAYLAARSAASHGDYPAATYWFAQALKADPGNPTLLEGATISAMGMGDFATAAKYAQILAEEGDQGQVGTLALVTEATKRGDDAALQALREAGRSGGALFDVLTAAWATAGAGEITDAIAAFDQIAANPEQGLFGAYHQALALASVGDFEGADRVLASDAGLEARALRRSILAHVEILSQLERNDEAIALLDEAFVPGQDPTAIGLRERLSNGEVLPWTIVQTPEHGMAEVFYTLATALRGEEGGSGYSLLLSRATAYLRPDHAEALLTAATLLNGDGQPDLAAETYAQVPTTAPEHYLAEMGRAETLVAAGKPDAAIEVMQSLARAYPKLRSVHATYGDMLRREEKFEDAAKAYDAAIALIDTPEADDWRLFFSRGICHERQKRWPQAEADMRKALDLSPDQAQVLNYLGYSYLEMNTNLDEALKLIERAVEVQPDSGAITDSLAWAYFRMGRHQDAVEPMERAAMMEPVDPVVTDHLGDVYWAVGRKLEAQFQWRRALSYEPEEKDAARIRRKLEIGLDQVLAEEGAAPLETQNVANDN